MLATHSLTSLCSVWGRHCRITGPYPQGGLGGTWAVPSPWWVGNP